MKPLHLLFGQRLRRQYIQGPEYRTRHTRVPVLGMRQDRRVEIEVTVRDRAGNATTAPNRLEFQPWPLPTEFPPIQINFADTAAMEPGVTLFNVLVFSPQFDTFLIMVDETGEVIWYYDGARAGLTAGEVVNAKASLQITPSTVATACPIGFPDFKHEVETYIAPKYH